MPIIAANISESVLRPIRELVERGHYQSLESFLEVAAHNQLALERSVSPDALIARGHRETHLANGQLAAIEQKSASDRVAAEKTEGGTEASRPKQRRSKKKKTRGRASGASARGKKVSPAMPPDVDVDATLARWAMPTKGKIPDTLPAVRRSADERLWGQVNRLFPVKLTCRWVATKAMTDGAWPRFAAVADGMVADAAGVGAVLERWDAEAERKRAEVLATGLPRRGNSASSDRFISQYLARMTRAEDVRPGAVCLYALAVCGESGVVLTDRGLEFARLANPILDGRDCTSKVTLDMAEANFIAKQIKEYAPGEHRDMSAILKAIAVGKNTPTDMAASVRELFPHDWSEIEFETHLSGLVARLADLRLLHRHCGLKVSPAGLVYRSCKDGYVHQIVLAAEQSQGDSHPVYVKRMVRIATAPFSDTVIDVTNKYQGRKDRPLTKDWTDVVLIGKRDDQDTVDELLPNATRKNWLIRQVNQRFYRFPPNVLVRNALRTYGCQQPLKVWGKVLLDGHRRLEICTKNPLPYETEQLELAGRDAAVLWVEENQLARHDLTDDQVGRRRPRPAAARGDRECGEARQGETQPRREWDARACQKDRRRQRHRQQRRRTRRRA